eukprot:364475-Chlamydomonas_euryale.AAC.2
MTKVGSSSRPRTASLPVPSGEASGPPTPPPPPLRSVGSFGDAAEGASRLHQQWREWSVQWCLLALCVGPHVLTGLLNFPFKSSEGPPSTSAHCRRSSLNHAKGLTHTRPP